MAQRGGQEALPGAALAGDDQVLVVLLPVAVDQPQQLVGGALAWVSRLVRSARAMPCRRIRSSLSRVAGY